MKKLQKLKKIAIILSHPYTGGVLVGAQNIARMFKLASLENHHQLEVIFAHIEDNVYEPDTFDSLKQMDIRVRAFKWHEISLADAQRVKEMSLQDFEVPVSVCGTYCYPEDGISAFCDVDYWFIIPDRVPHQLLPLKPYSFVGYDYLQRYFDCLPKPYNDVLITNSRYADYVFVTTHQTQTDAINYLGIAQKKAVLLPLEFSIYENEDNPRSKVQQESKYFLWLTNSALHKNQINVFKALAYYYNNLEGKLKCKVCGVYSDIFLPQKKLENELAYFNQFEHVTKSRKIVEKENLTDKIDFHGFISDSLYAQLLQEADFVLHGNNYDNGSFILIEAAYYGIPALSTQYPVVDFFNERFQLNLQFCDSNDFKNIAHQLKYMEENSPSLQQCLPTKAFLSQFCWNKCANSFYSTVMERIDQ